MKKTGLTFLLTCCLLGFSAKAQTETVASKPKKLEQLYLNLGFGPNITKNKRSGGWGETLNATITAASDSNHILRLGYMHATFTGFLAGAGILDIPQDDYYVPVESINRMNSVYLAVGKRKTINRKLQVQAFGGLSINQHIRPYDFWYESIKAGNMNCRLFLESHYLPGVIVQGEAMFLPKRYAGLTLGAYYHFVPGISNAGLTLSLNLGKLRPQEIL